MKKPEVAGKIQKRETLPRVYGGTRLSPGTPCFTRPATYMEAMCVCVCVFATLNVNEVYLFNDES